MDLRVRLQLRRGPATPLSRMTSIGALGEQWRACTPETSTASGIDTAQKRGRQGKRGRMTDRQREGREDAGPEAGEPGTHSEEDAGPGTTESGTRYGEDMGPEKEKEEEPMMKTKV
ncbi:hypothetical protein NDU88_002693 [Pleurodeles waltl]|uniref:Uncharacterized protein n=1 Tax=Pleurodeles waltl TaxID=8319 RepID=A0AAV7Q7E9_PLEWA|nr:hypothetical protein NDU88_002693 [Pleurodeles waltl]